MKKIMQKFADTFKIPRKAEPENEQEYVELDTSSSNAKTDSKVIVRPFVLDDFSGIKQILEALRDGYTIALINIKPLRDKDLIELKRAINKLKKTTDAMEGSIAGFGEDYIVIAPSFAQIYRSPETQNVEAQ